MRFLDKEVILKDGIKCILRSPNENDAEKMIEYLRMTSGETYFMIRYPEEITATVEEEAKFLKNSIQSEKELMIAAFIDGELAGNAGLNCVRNRKKVKHRAEFGISIKHKFWNRGIGNILISQMIEEAKEMGYEQIELGVYSDNKKAQALYKKYGFEVWGTIKNAYKLNDGIYRDEIIMGKMLF
ncbi:GNAT family N-acetyltransferase [Clostridium sp. SM-530-WT-3G]|uniref:GNAT family N-acetyltransferase n=1 Tax=Clostridium sp. SM-530-WT-3G TaxID=2725303 RepID=UPI00145C8757|nr:GNAT family N-acetyltransferase [Clostridium sp. SM-530-WT-3G]NME81946.1 GNAT family N-acetyltransferase [Clostridium sp. SM-530-WT-3G]